MYILEQTKRKIKSYSQKELIRRVLKLVPKASDRNLITMLRLARKLPRDSDNKEKRGDKIKRGGQTSLLLSFEPHYAL